MRAGALARLIVLAGLAAVTADGAQAATRIRLAQTSNVTNCMMSCNAQATQCQTTCLVPGTPPTGAATTGATLTKTRRVSSTARRNAFPARRIVRGLRRRLKLS